jgi:hypothetical protein
MSFATQISLFVKQGKQAPKKTRDAVILKLFRRVIFDTPVDVGRLIGNWNTSIASADLSTDNLPSGGAEPLAKANAKIKRAEMAQDIYFTNNLPYAEAIENGHGGRPAGVMVQRNVLLFKKNMTEEAARQRMKKR